MLGTDKAGDFDGRHADTILLLSLDNASGKVRVMVSIFGRETPVELSFDQVAKV